MTPFTSSTTQFFSSSSSSFTTQNLLLLLFTTIFIFSHGTTAQDSSPAPPPPTPYFNPRFNPTMAIIIVILIAAFFFLGFFSIYLRQCRNDPGRSSWGGPATTARSRGVGARGLDPELIEKFPTLMYSEVKVHKIGKGALECAVCLSEFEDDQMLRLLPICDHVFHPECIDQWLGSHTTCPVCRTNLAVAVDLSNSNIEQQSVATPAEEGGGDLRSSGRRDEVSIPVRNEVEQVDRTASPPPVLDLRRGGSLRAAARSILSWGSKSARPAVGAQAGQLWSEEERERFTLRLPDYVRQDVLAGKLSRSISVTVFPTEESLCRGFRGGGGMDGEGSSRGGGRSLKLRGGGQARFDRWAFLTSFNWRSVAGGGVGGDGEGSIRREGSIKREGSTRRGGGGDSGGLEGSTKGLFGPLDCLGSSGGGSGGNSSVKRNGSTTRKDADGE